MRTPPRTVAELVALAESGAPVEFLFFWGHRVPRDGAVGKWCLSQWAPVEFTDRGVRFPTAEHFMMREKALLFGDSEAARQVLADDDPAHAKRVGRTVRGYDEDIWVKHRDDIVVRANLAKFGQHPELAEYLRGTGDAVLVEASPVDAIWGIGLAADHPDAAHPSRWPGRNLLGFALMRVRATL